MPDGNIPLLAGTKVGESKLGSTGPAMQGVVLRIDNPDRSREKERSGPWAKTL
jgi:hypothetical protein